MILRALHYCICKGGESQSQHKACGWEYILLVVMPFVTSIRKLPMVLHAAFAKRPMFANSCTGFVTFMTGDILSQSGYISSDRIDIMRSFRTGCLGVFMNGVTLHYWYRALDRMFGVSMKSKKNVIMKCVADQLVYAPFSIIAFFSYAAGNKGGSVSDIKTRFAEKFEESFIDTWIADCSVWPLINFISFSLIPIHIRPTFVGFAQIGWQTYMSYVGYRDTASFESPDLSLMM